MSAIHIFLSSSPKITKFDLKAARKKNFKGDSRPQWGCATKTWSFSSARKNLGAQHPSWAEIWSSEKVDLGENDFTTRSP